LRAAFAGRTLATSRTFISKELVLEEATMSRVKQASIQKRKGKAGGVQVLGAAGLGLSLVSGASASTTPTIDVPQSGNPTPNQRFVLGEEEMADVSLATFYLFDKENVGGRGVQIARGCGGCGCGHGCGGGCRGCGGGCRGCAGCRIGGCGGCGGCGFGFGGGIIACIACAGCAGCAGCCLSWGSCRLC